MKSPFLLAQMHCLAIDVRCLLYFCLGGCFWWSRNMVCGVFCQLICVEITFEFNSCSFFPTLCKAASVLQITNSAFSWINPTGKMIALTTAVIKHTTAGKLGQPQEDKCSKLIFPSVSKGLYFKNNIKKNPEASLKLINERSSVCIKIVYSKNFKWFHFHSHF